MEQPLDHRLTETTYQLGMLADNRLLLSKNALFPWFILVPSTQETEYHKLRNEQQTEIQQHINAIARFIENNFSIDKINIATIGNIVSQLHIHIIGRSRNDACWPDVVWGTAKFKAYQLQEVNTIKTELTSALKETFQGSNKAG